MTDHVIILKLKIIFNIPDFPFTPMSYMKLLVIIKGRTDAARVMWLSKPHFYVNIIAKQILSVRDKPTGETRCQESRRDVPGLR